MSIKLVAEKGSFSIKAFLSDDALPALLEVVAKHQIDEPHPAGNDPFAMLFGKRDNEPPAPLAPEPPIQPQNDKSTAVKAFLASHASSEVVNMFPFENFPEKITLIAAHYESTGGSEGWKSSDIYERFKESKSIVPGNFPRDIATAIREGLIATVTARTYKVGKVGWNMIAGEITRMNSGTA